MDEINAIDRQFTAADSILWTQSFKKPISVAPICLGELLIVALQEASQTAVLRAFSLADGVFVWEVFLPDALVTGMLRYSDEAVLVSLTGTNLLNSTGGVVFVDVSGKLHWRWIAPAIQVSALVFYDNLIWLTSGATALIALDPVSGDECQRINFSTYQDNASFSAPAFCERGVYIPCRGPQILALDRAAGSLLWCFSAAEEQDDAWFDMSPLISGDALFAVTSTGVVFSINLESGDTLWRTQVGPSGKSLSAPVSDGVNFYVGARDGVYALDLADGRVVWTFVTTNYISAAPRLLGDEIYATCRDHYLYVLNRESGRMLWSYPMEHGIKVSPLLLGDPLLGKRALVVDRVGAAVLLVLPLTSLEHEAAGRWLLAARLGESAGDLARAVLNYERAEAWPHAARLWELLERPLKQAESLERHARLLHTESASLSTQGQAWSAAANLFESEGLDERARMCQREAARCLKLPVLNVMVEYDALLWESWSQLRFIVRNEGFGAALDLIIRAHGDEFEGQVMTTQRMTKLLAGRERVEHLDIRPLEHGDVPLRLQVEYFDQLGEPHVLPQTIYITVSESQNVQVNKVLLNGLARLDKDGYDKGFLELRAHLSREVLPELSELEEQLHENLRREQVFGSTEALRSARSEIVYALNELTVKYLGLSFDTVCLGGIPAVVGNEITPSFTEVQWVDLEVRISAKQSAGYPVQVTLDDAQHFAGYLASGIELWRASGDLLRDGQALFDVLFADVSLRDAWSRAQGKAEAQGGGRRVRLWIEPEASGLHALPWEMLTVEGIPLAANSKTPFSRYLPTESLWGQPLETYPIRVLVLISNPTDLRQRDLLPLDVAAERANLERAFAGVSKDMLQMDFLEAPVTLNALGAALQEGYHIMHYIGHGVMSKQSRQAALLMQDKEGQTALVREQDLREIVSFQSFLPSLVFLSACQSAKRDSTDAFVGLAPVLVRAGIPAVVAMQDFISAHSAQVLSQNFYKRLLDHGEVDRALNEARMLLLMENRSEAAVPVLFMRMKSGRLWSV